MRLAWHIAKKDIRRLALPVSVWLGLILAPAIVFSVASPSIEGNATSSIDIWGRVFAIWMRLLVGIQIFIGYLLAGSLVLEDPLLGTTSFGATRPISNARLFAAKILAAVGLFLVAPILVLTPVWLASGFSLIDIGRAGLDFATRFGVATLLALMTASVAVNLAQFLFFSLVIVGTFAATAIIPQPLWRDASMVVRASREWLVMAGALPAAAAVATHQFLTRRSARTWMIIACVLLATAVIRCAWPWEIHSAIAARHSGAPRPGDRSNEIVAAPAFTKHSPNSVPSLYGKTMWRPEGFSVPVYARAPDGTYAMRAGGMWEAEAGLRVLGFKDTAGPLVWQLHRLGWRPSDGGEANFTGTLEAWVVRATVLGEVPVRVGAELRYGATRVRILGLVSHEERIHNIYVEERDAQARAAAGWSQNWVRRESGGERYIDGYFLVSRAAKQAQHGSAGELGSLEMNSLAVRFRSLSVNWPHAWGEPTLVKVRFERDHAFEIPVEVHGVSSRGWEQIP